MGLMDKIKAQAEQVATKAQEGSAQMKAKIEQTQAKRGVDTLLRDLGAAYYAEQRQAGPHDAVENALTALDAHVSDHGPIDVSTTGPQAAPSKSAPADGTTPSGDFKLEDV